MPATVVPWDVEAVTMHPSGRFGVVVYNEEGISTFYRLDGLDTGAPTVTKLAIPGLPPGELGALIFNKEAPHQLGFGYIR